MKQTRELDSDVAPRSEVKYSIWNTVCVCSRARLSRSSILFVYVVTLVQGVMLCLDYRQGPWWGLNSHTVAFLSSQFFISLIQFQSANFTSLCISWFSYIFVWTWWNFVRSQAFMGGWMHLDYWIVVYLFTYLFLEVWKDDNIIIPFILLKFQNSYQPADSATRTSLPWMLVPCTDESVFVQTRIFYLFIYIYIW